MNGQELKLLRMKLDLTQKQLAEKLGISHSAIVKLESGENKMSRPVSMLLKTVESNFYLEQI